MQVIERRHVISRTRSRLKILEKKVRNLEQRVERKRDEKELVVEEEVGFLSCVSACWTVFVFVFDFFCDNNFFLNVSLYGNVIWN